MYMKVLTTSTDEQILKIIPRSYASSVTLKLRDDSTNTIITETLSAITQKGYLVISNAFNLKEGRFYDLKILEGTNVIYLDRVFCTDQTINQNINSYYSVNKNTYTSAPSDNDYIIS